MARSTRNDPERQLVPELESALQERADGMPPQDQALGRLDPAQEPLNIGHACLRSACWAPLRQGMRRQRPARKRTPLHGSRPAQAAEARFTSDGYEFIS